MPKPFGNGGHGIFFSVASLGRIYLCHIKACSFVSNIFSKHSFFEQNLDEHESTNQRIMHVKNLLHFKQNPAIGSRCHHKNNLHYLKGPHAVLRKIFFMHQKSIVMHEMIENYGIQ